MPSTRKPQTTLVVVGLLALVVLSGCAGISDSGPSTPSPTATSTPVPTPTATPASSPTPTATPVATPTPTATPTPAPSEQLLPGLTAAGVQNVTQLISTHQAAAIETPGVVTHTTDTGVGGISVVASVRVAAQSNLTRVQYVSEGRRTTGSDVQNTTSAIVANETAVRQYSVADGNVTLNNTQDRTELFDRSLRGLSTARNPLQGALRRGEFTLAGEDELNGTTVLTLRADEYAGGQRYDAENVVAYNATVRISAAGLIRAATERIVVERNGDESQYNFTYEFTPRSVDLPPAPQVPDTVRVAATETSDD